MSPAVFFYPDLPMAILEGSSRRYGFHFRYFSDDSYVGREILHDNFEPVESLLFCSLLGPSSVVLDVGANLGYYSLLAGSKNVRCLAVEPQSANYQLLTDNLALNGYTSVETRQVALGQYNDVMPLYLCKRDGEVLNHGDHRLWQASSQELEWEEVLVVRGDELLWEWGHSPTILKLDTQGYEFFILEGLSEVLDSGGPMFLFAEFSTESYKALGQDPADCFRLLSEQFEQLHIVDDATRTAIQCPSLDFLEQYRAMKRHSHANLFCARGANDLGCPIPSSNFAIR